MIMEERDENVNEGPKGLPYLLYAVDQIPYCLWGFDIQERNLSFLKSIDSDNIKNKLN